MKLKAASLEYLVFQNNQLGKENPKYSNHFPLKYKVFSLKYKVFT